MENLKWFVQKVPMKNTKQLIYDVLLINAFTLVTMEEKMTQDSKRKIKGYEN
jgi:hypothetical protein